MTPDTAEAAGAASVTQGLAALLAYLRRAGYAFVTPTPETHRRVIRRLDRARAQDLRGVFGWSLPFDRGLLPAELLRILEAADAIEKTAAGLRAGVRVSSLAGDLFLHSAFPPGKDAVFFGPDTYRFARFLEASADGREIGAAVEVGVGSGAGAVVVARRFHARRLLATDINPAALRLAAVNLAAAGVTAELVRTDGLSGVAGPADLIVANPPFIADDGGPTYRDGGDMHGARLSLDWTLAGADRLAPGGRMLLYTGSAIVGGRDALREALAARLDPARFSLDYAELDPDIFGDQLAAEAYRDVERIAAVGAVVTRRP